MSETKSDDTVNVPNIPDETSMHKEPMSAVPPVSSMEPSTKTGSKTDIQGNRNVVGHNNNVLILEGAEFMDGLKALLGAGALGGLRFVVKCISESPELADRNPEGASQLVVDIQQREFEQLRKDPDFLGRLGWFLTGTLGTLVASEWRRRYLEPATPPPPAPSPPEPQPQPKKRPKLTSRRSFEPELVLVPAGKFLMGSDQYDKQARDDEKPQHTVYLLDYYIGKYPVTNAQYRAFVWDKVHRAPWHWENGRIPRGEEEHPVVEVSWDDAVAYCKWLAVVTGKPYRLPTEAEWEKAARGTDGHIYPWGNFWDSTRRNSWEGDGTTPVGQYSPRGDSPCGCADMVGNVWEWTQTCWTSNYEHCDDRVLNDLGKDCSRRVVRGGAFNILGDRSVRCAYRSLNHGPDYCSADGGFRVVVAAAPTDSGL